MGFLLSIYLKDNSYDFILVIVDYLTKMVYYKLIKTNINIARLVKTIISIIVKYYNLSKFIISD